MPNRPMSEMNLPSTNHVNQQNGRRDGLECASWAVRVTRADRSMSSPLPAILFISTRSFEDIQCIFSCSLGTRSTKQVEGKVACMSFLLLRDLCSVLIVFPGFVAKVKVKRAPEPGVTRDARSEKLPAGCKVPALSQ